MKQTTSLAAGLLLTSSIMLGCAGDAAPTDNGSEKVEGNGGPDLTISDHDDGYQQATVDASQSEWIYLDLETMSQVFPETPDSDDIWDLAFEAAAIKSNGGVSGAPPTAEEVYIYADKVADDVPYDWDVLATSPEFDASTWHQDTSTAGDSGNPNDDGEEDQYAFSTYPAPDQDPSSTVCGDYGWYYYNFFCAQPAHAIVERVNVAYVVRSTDCRYYRLRMTDYFSAEGLSKYPQFDVEEIEGDACDASSPGDIEFPDFL